MNVICLALVAVSLVAEGDRIPSKPAQISVVAIQALNENRTVKHFGPGLSGVRRAVASLDYDSFYRLSSANVPAPYGEEIKIHINERYTLYLTPIARTETGRIRMKARITMKAPDRAIKALDTTLTMLPGSHLNLGGLRLKRGELIVVISVT